MLSVGGDVDPKTAELIVQRDDVAGVGDTLFAELGCHAQTFRFTGS